VIRALQMTFTATGKGGTYLTIDRSIDETSHVASVGITGGGSQITLAITLSEPGTGNGTASGHFGATTFRWNGHVNLAANPESALVDVADFDRNAFASQLAEASYFGPACRMLIGVSDGFSGGPQPPPLPPSSPPPAPVAPAQAESWGEFLAKAGVWGLAALAAGALTVETGGLDLVVVAGLFLSGADASMGTDLINQMFNQNPLPNPVPLPPDPGGPDPAPGPGPDPFPSPDPSPDPGPDPFPSPDPSPGPDNGGEDPGCFAAGTLVATENGKRRPIEEIRVSDLVASRDQQSRADGMQRVLRTWTHHNNETIDLRLATGETIRTTSVHRIFTLEQGVVDVRALQVGDHVETLSAGPQPIEDITPGPGSVTVYNLAVDGYHTYFVGAAGMWVHNEKVIGDPGGDVPDPDPAGRT